MIVEAHTQSFTGESLSVFSCTHSKVHIGVISVLIFSGVLLLRESNVKVPSPLCLCRILGAFLKVNWACPIKVQAALVSIYVDCCRMLYSHTAIHKSSNKWSLALTRLNPHCHTRTLLIMQLSEHSQCLSAEVTSQLPLVVIFLNLYVESDEHCKCKRHPMGCEAQLA